jgi:hypothetical protein
MTGNIIGEPFDPFVINQMLYRQAYQYLGMNENRTEEMLKYMSNRNAWVKLASGVNIIGKDGEERLKHLGLSSSEVDDLKGLGLAKKSILFNGMSEFKDNSYKQRSGVRTNVKYSDSIEGVGGVEHLWGNSAYGLGSIKQGQQPMPGITDLSIDCVNRGSIRKATVNIKAHNKFQFEIIETLYLRLGYSMLIEWGWDKYINGGNQLSQVGNTLCEDVWFQDLPTNTFRNVIDTIEKYRARYEGTKVSSLLYNTYTSASIDYSGDSSYGKTAAIDKNARKIGIFTEIESSLFLPGRNKTALKYLIDEFGELTELNQRNAHWEDIQRTFIAGDYLNISQFDNQKFSNQLSSIDHTI